MMTVKDFVLEDGGCVYLVILFIMRGFMFALSDITSFLVNFGGLGISF